MLEIKELHAHYGQIEALKGISLTVEKGEIVCLIGANGAGKSTLLNAICGNPSPSAGSVLYQGQELRGLPTHRISRAGIALVPEGRRIFANLTVEENLQLGGFFHSDEDNYRGLQRAYELFPRLRERQLQRAGTLSGGEQQMLAIGRGLMMRPQLLLLDEPSLGLAPLVIGQIFEIIKAIRDEGMTILLVEQNANKALQIADRGYVLELGRISQEDRAENLLNSSHVREAYLGL